MSLKRRAQQNIEKNWRGNFTVPTDKLYPFQWMWDSGFVAMGTATYDLDLCMKEIEAMFSGQWDNGMLPHIVFHSENESTYFPNWDFWNCDVNTGASQKPKTSGITQPPVYGFILEEILEEHGDDPRVVDFVRNIYHKAVKYHEFLYTYRDHENEGLFFIFHPWESGRDNSPLWDESLDRIKIDLEKLPEYTRKDTQQADASERPTKEQYDRYVYLLELGKKYKYDGPEIAKESPFLVQDCMMNSILIRSNESLIKLGKSFGYDVDQLEKWQELSKANFARKFWNDELKTFVSYDQRGGKQIVHHEIGGYVALFANMASAEQTSHLIKKLRQIHERGYYLCPSFDIDSPLFDSKRYWRGPVWPQMNWMIYKGLLKYGEVELANIVKDDLLELVEINGFYEYFESEKEKARILEKGYGGADFSWTSSTILKFLKATDELD